MSQPPAQTKIEFCPTGNQVYLVKDPQKPADSQKVQGGAMYGENLRRKWQILPGRNKYYCDGRIIMARQTSVFYVNLALIVGTMGLFFGFDAPYLWNELNPVMPLIAAALTLLSVSSLVRCAFSDPGILPRATPAEAEEIERQIAAEAQNSPTAGQGNAPHPRLRTVIINGQPVNMKYCMTCKVFRPPRASHCGICDNCIDRFDHHCPWVGNCVGKRNYRYFYFFLVSLSFLCVYVFACSAVHLILSAKDKGFLETLQKTPGRYVFILLKLKFCFC